jgi:Domain of unknown function (DUF4850)
VKLRSVSVLLAASVFVGCNAGATSPAAALLIPSPSLAAGSGAPPSTLPIPTANMPTPTVGPSAEPAEPSPAPSPSAAPSPATAPDVQVTLPVIACPMDPGWAQAYGPNTPKKSFGKLTLPADAAKRLAVYATTYYGVLAPRGWHCFDEESEDGSSILTITPATRTWRAITYVDIPGCFGCMLDLACPLFPAAARIAMDEFGEACARPPKKERVRRLGPGVVWFEDGPRVAGSGDGSGGGHTAVGVVQYEDANGPNRWAAKLTCILPTKDRGLCTVIINQLIRPLTAPSP